MAFFRLFPSAHTSRVPSADRSYRSTFLPPVLSPTQTDQADRQAERAPAVQEPRRPTPGPLCVAGMTSPTGRRTPCREGVWPGRGGRLTESGRLAELTGRGPSPAPSGAEEGGAVCRSEKPVSVAPMLGFVSATCHQCSNASVLTSASQRPYNSVSVSTSQCQCFHFRVTASPSRCQCPNITVLNISMPSSLISVPSAPSQRQFRDRRQRSSALSPVHL